MVYKTSVSYFKVKITPLKHTACLKNVKRMLSSLLVDKGRLFFTKLSFKEFEIHDEIFSLHCRLECLACFETQLRSKIFEEFSGTFCTLIVKKITLKFKRKFNMYL